VLASGASRKRIARTLNAAYADGLLSHETFTHRLDQLLRGRLIDPSRLVGDLSFRRAVSWRTRLRGAVAMLKQSFVLSRPLEVVRDEILLALDWTGATAELLVGRHHGCDVVLDEPTVSRMHARLLFRDGSWVVQDLESTNGTIVNGAQVGRCSLRPGDRILLGNALLRID
jgi:pSer/pThr/pTyr-binding forkhead associated (FHA) protein